MSMLSMSMDMSTGTPASDTSNGANSAVEGSIEETVLEGEEINDQPGDDVRVDTVIAQANEMIGVEDSSMMKEDTASAASTASAPVISLSSALLVGFAIFASVSV